MKQLNIYIIEKLKINKDSKIKKTKHKNVTENMFRRALNNFGEVDLTQLYDEEDLPTIEDYDETRAVKSLYPLDKGTIYYAYFNKVKGYDCESLFPWGRMNEDDINYIYDYMLEN